jgi:hypothetical protein
MSAVAPAVKARNVAGLPDSLDEELVVGARVAAGRIAVVVLR